MRIVIAGSSGFVGRRLVGELERRGHQLVRLLRPGSPAAEERSTASWDPAAGRLDPALLDGADAVVNLCGRNIGDGRWSRRVKDELTSSRVEPTRTLARAISAANAPPPLLLNFSATGYYGDRGDELLDEGSAPGDDFLARLCVAWEAEACDARSAATRVVLLRLGMVVGRGGAVGRMLLPFKLGLGGPIGSGRQWWPWVAMDDVVGTVLHLLESGERWDGPLNLVSPEATRCADFSRAVGRALGRPAVLPAPAFAVRALLGEMADALLLASARVRPTVLQERLGYGFRAASLDRALSQALS